jgi:chitodextrinase
VNPTDKDLTGVTIRGAVGAVAPASQVDGTAVTDTGRDDTTFTVHGLTADTEYSYALFAHDSSGNFSRTTAVTLRTGRFGVSFLNASQVTRTAVTLGWVNPTDNAFTGVIVRRADGSTPPASATDGTAVGADMLSPADSVTDSGLTAGTTYSYAVFAHDGAQHVAAAVTATVTTRGNGLSSVLAVNPLPWVHTGDRVTVGTPVAFDGSDTLPAVGADLVSWDISYGDHVSDSFNGSLGPVDILNTTHMFADAGPHTVTLTVRDSDGNTDSTTLAVDVFGAPHASVSTSSSSPAAGVVPFEITTDTPPDTAITSYRMEFTGDDTFFLDGDSAPPASEDVTLHSGSYRVILSVTNDAGGTAVSAPVNLEVP